MIQRYHLDLALVSVVLGVVVALIAARVPVAASRAMALCGAIGAVLGSLGISRGLPWMVAAAAMLLPADDSNRPHPLGRWTAALAVVALAGTWSAVPDTEPPLAAGLALAPAGLWFLVRPRPPGPVGTAALVVAIAGAVWTGSAGRGSALAAVGAVGLLATAPVVSGFRPLRSGTCLRVLVGCQFAVGLFLPRLVAFRSVPVAAAIAVGANAALVAVAFRCREGSPAEPR